MARKKAEYPQPPGGKQPSKKNTVAQSDFQEVSKARRLKSVQDGRDVFNRFVQDNVLRSSTFAQTRNQTEGGRPFDPNLFRQQGADWQTNVNFGDARAAIDRTLLPYWKMINDSPHKVAVTIESNAPESEQWQMAFAECFDEFLEDWGADYFVQYMNFAWNFVNFGPGVVQWTEDETVRFEAVNVQRIYFPKNAKMSPDSWEVLALQRDMSATEMYAKIRDKETTRRSEYVGWNANAIKAAIVQMKDGGTMPDYRDYTRWADQLVNNDIAVTTPFQPLPIVWLFIKNFDDKIGCYAFSQQDGVNEFLFEKDDYAESFRHLLGAVWYDTGSDAMVHSIKGFGIKNYHFSALVNRMKSRFVDSGTMSMGINFQYDSENVPDEAPPVENYGPFTVFPSNLKQLNVYPQIQAAAGVIEMLENNASQNNALYRQQQQQIQQSDTATQAEILATMAGQLSEASAAIFLSQVGENIFSEQMRRLRKKGSKDEDAKRFVERMREKGVPDEVIFKKRIRVKTGANASMANPALRAQMFQQDLQLMNVPGVNGRWFLQNMIANKYGSQAVSKALLPEGAQSNPLQRREALIENNLFGQGQPLPVDPSDAHFEHIEEHLGPLEGIIGAFQRQGNITPEQTAALALGTEHTGEHMGYLQRNETMKAQFQQVLPRFRVVQSTARGILTRMQSQQQGPSPVQGGDVVPLTG